MTTMADARVEPLDAVVAGLRAAVDQVDGLAGVEAAHAALAEFRAVAGPDFWPSIYTIEGDRLWLIAQIGYTEILDGISLDTGVMSRAARTGETVFVGDTSADEAFLSALSIQPGFASEICVPEGGFIINIESMVALDPAMIPHVESFARVIVERLTANAAPPFRSLSTARALVPMAGLANPELIAEYACRLVSQLLDLEVAQVAVRSEAVHGVDVFWRRPGTGFEPVDRGLVLDEVRRFRRVASWTGHVPSGYAPSWPGVTDYVFLPFTFRGQVLGGLVGAGNGFRFDKEVWEALALIAAQAGACLDRAIVERQLAAAVAAKSDFIATVSHELRTPLTSMLGFADLILGDDVESDGERLEFLQTIRDNADHLLALITEILDLSRADAGMLDVGDEELDLDRLVAETVAYLAPRAKERRVAIEYEPAGLAVRGDAVRVRQIMVNLLTNALKYTEDGSVRVSAESSHGYVSVAVEDDGRGISADVLPRLFRPFARAPAEVDATGTGLGLVISRRLAEAMGGTLDLFSDGLGHGATALLQLPAVR